MKLFFPYHETIKKLALKIRKGDRLLFVIKKTGVSPVYVKVGAQCIALCPPVISVIAKE